MTDLAASAPFARNIARYPWFKFCQNLLFWQAVWFLFFQNRLSAAEAILLYAIYDIGTTVLEVPSGYMSDRLGRRVTLIFSALAGCAGMAFLAFGDGFWMFAAAQVLIGASSAFASGTDTALLYESLTATDRQDEVEAQELRAWRFSFAGLALSAGMGGAMAMLTPTLPFIASALAFAAVLALCLSFREPPRSAHDIAEGAEVLRVRSLGAALRNPVLTWFLLLGLLTYTFSHVPFVFGQPFILQALAGSGLDGEAPLISGLVSATMMVVSVLVSILAPALRTRLGLPLILMVAFAMQVALCAVLALSGQAIVILFLFLRMVPDSLSRPFMLARIQPLLRDDSRATYLSVQSLCARLAFAGSLYLASLSASDAGQMPHDELRLILGCYALAGLVGLVVLALGARRLPIESPDRR